MKVTNWQAENITISWPIFIIAHSHLKLLKTLVAMNPFLLSFFTPCKKLLKASYIVAMVTYQVLNSSPIDECGEGACKVWGGSRKNMRRVTMTTLWAATTQAPSHWILSGTLNTYQYLPRGRGGTGAKLFSASVHAAQHERNGWHQQGSCKFTEALQKP